MEGSDSVSFAGLFDRRNVEEIDPAKLVAGLGKRSREHQLLLLREALDHPEVTLHQLSALLSVVDLQRPRLEKTHHVGAHPELVRSEPLREVFVVTGGSGFRRRSLSHRR
jgi:hypothetical protein